MSNRRSSIEEPGILGQVYEKFSDDLYLLFRLIIGFLFTLHGCQKLFGFFTERGAVEFSGLLWFAGLTELVGGTAIAIGLLTRVAASITLIEMLIAYFKVHFTLFVFPIQRGGGEVPILFIAAFLVFMVHGSGRWGIERLLTNKEKF